MRAPGARRCRWLLAISLAALTLCVTATTALASFTQEPGSPYTVGANPYGVLLADFDSDTRPDVVVINGTSSTASVLLRQPLGGFAEEAGSPVAVGSGPNYGAVGDFNVDGRSDIAVANYVSDNVTILVRQPGSGFAQALGSPIPAGSRPAGLVAADFNGDTLLDLAVPDYLGNIVTILLRQGGTFVAETGSPATGARPRNVATADFNGDGRPDLAVTNYNSDNVTILLRNAGPGFTQEAGSPIAVDTGPAGITAEDLNGDGRADLAVTNYKANTITVLLRNKAGNGFTQEGAPIAVGSGPRDIATGDFNSDRARDLAITNNAGNSVTVLLRAGAGYRPDAGSPVPTAIHPHGVKSADFNADGRPDLAISNDGSNNLTVLLNTTPPGTPPPPPVRPSPSSPSSSPTPRPSPGVKRIRSTVTVDWSVFKRYTNADTLVVHGVPARGKVVARCKGRGCQFKGPRSFKRKKSTVSLTKAFKHKRLPVGAVIEIAITAPNRIGRVFRYKVRSGLRPKKSTLCLPVGSSKPKLKC